MLETLFGVSESSNLSLRNEVVVTEELSLECMCRVEIESLRLRGPKEAYPIEIESQMRERRNRNTDFPITFAENALNKSVPMNISILKSIETLNFTLANTE